MLTLAEADILIAILSTILALTMLGAFISALFQEKYRRTLAILTGVMAALLLVVMVVALAAPFIFPS
ncbi:MAG: hypothetical protein HWN66_12200 [Candidatus Helarchaeota archaeon]|nr:hypothetical protein [Candidatus Helarchaeota archaeon]